MFYNPTDSGAVQLKADNLDMTLGIVDTTQYNFACLFNVTFQISCN